MEPKSPSGNRNANPNIHPSKPMMTFHFLRALSHIQQTRRGSSFAGRSGRIRRAAYSSMAYSTGTGRAWSRALLRKLRNRARRQLRHPRRARTVILPRRIRVARPQVRQLDRAQVLRKLVPGGTGMDYCSLLEETADYIRCLTTQVIGKGRITADRLTVPPRTMTTKDYRCNKLYI